MKQLLSNMIVVVEGSDASLLAAKYAIIMAKQCRASLTAVYVVDSATIRQLTMSKIFVEEESQEYEKRLEATGERYLSFVEELARAKGLKINRELRHGAVFSEVLKAAEERKAGLIILGGWEQNRSTHDIMANAKCSVLLVNEPDIDQLYKQA
jgi:nucleotide-binding universal stress UspA family protein